MNDSTIIFTILFLIFAILLLVTSIKAVQDKNIVHSATWLMFFLFSMAGLFLLLGSSLVASIELLVYVGAIVTLLVFTLMLTGGKEFE
jgi:NADH-quinone oxidoreductase subunit J